jgi:hypothetical protein
MHNTHSQAQGHKTKAQSIFTNPIWSSGIQTHVAPNGSSRRSRIICTQSNNLPHYKQEHVGQELHKFAKTLNGISLGVCNRTHDRLSILHNSTGSGCAMDPSVGLPIQCSPQHGLFAPNLSCCHVVSHSRHRRTDIGSPDHSEPWYMDLGMQTDAFWVGTIGVHAESIYDSGRGGRSAW